MYSSIDNLINDFFDSYKNVKNEFNDYWIGWYLKREVKVKYNNNGILSFVFEEQSFTGGAHPNSSKEFFNFNLNKSKLITLDDIVIAEKLSEMNEIAESEFRKLKKLDKNDSLNKSGYTFSNDMFKLNDNFYISDSSLIFYFNDYEIAPHSMGTTTLSLNYKLLAKVLNMNGVIKGVTTSIN